MCSAKFHCKFQMLCNNLEIQLTMGKIEPFRVGKSQGKAPARTPSGRCIPGRIPLPIAQMEGHASQSISHTCHLSFFSQPSGKLVWILESLTQLAAVLPSEKHVPPNKRTKAASPTLAARSQRGKDLSHNARRLTLVGESSHLSAPFCRGCPTRPYLSYRFSSCCHFSSPPPRVTAPGGRSPLAGTRPRSGCWSPSWKSWNTGPAGCFPAPGALPSPAGGRGCAEPRSAGRTSAGGASWFAELGAAAAGGGGGDGGGGGGAPCDAGWQTCPPRWGIPRLCKTRKKWRARGRTCGQIFHGGRERIGRTGASLARWREGCAGSQRAGVP